MPQDSIVPYGYCHCKCGGKTQIAQKTANDRGHIKGQPKRFIMGHGRTEERPCFDDAMSFKIDGVYCKLIPLTQGQFSIVDASLYETLRRFRWYAAYSKNVHSFYAVRTCTKTRRTIRMHTEITGLVNVDHENNVTLDNRTANLRNADDYQSASNRRKPRHNTSGFKGVMRGKTPGTWIAQIKAHGVLHHVGTFKSKVAAALAYDDKCVELHGNFAKPNG